MKRTYTFHGLNPEPWTPGSFSKVRKRAMVFKDEKLRTYQLAIKADLEAMDLDGVLEAGVVIHDLRFAFWRDTSHGRPADATNLQKATEDALQGLLFADDRWVKSVRSVIVEQAPDVSPAVVVQMIVGDDFDKWWTDEPPAEVMDRDQMESVEAGRRADYEPDF